MTEPGRIIVSAFAAALALVLGLGGCQSAQHACRHHGGVSRTVNQWAICNDGTRHSMSA